MIPAFILDKFNIMQLLSIFKNNEIIYRFSIQPTLDISRLDPARLACKSMRILHTFLLLRAGQATSRKNPAMCANLICTMCANLFEIYLILFESRLK